MRNNILSVIFGITLTVLLISFSIGLPIYFRPFYYIQIDTLGMVEDTGYDYGTIKDAYDEVLDYLTVPGNGFGTGELKHSESGAAHFADCKVLFDLNYWCFLVSLSLVLVLLILRRCRIYEPSTAFGFGPGFYTGVGTLSLFALLGIVVAADFDSAFVVFHSIFFPGKDNWLFDPSTDEIIRVMPAEFFMNCAILIASSVILISVLLIVFGVRKRKKQRSH